MKTLAQLFIVLVNAVFLLLGASAAVTPGVPVSGRLIGAVVSLGLLAAISCLLLKRLGRLPTWGDPLMRAACIGVSALWLIGSMDHNMISGQEWAFVLVAGALMWATWRVFRW